MTAAAGNATIVSVQVGLPKTLPHGESSDSESTWSTAIFKRPVEGPVWLGALNLQGDGQADRVHHGGVDKAVCAYSADHGPFWRGELGGPDVPGGAFGENLTIAGLTESDICIGDTWEVGEARLQVSQPRQPCWKLSRHWQVKDMALRVQQSGRTGWYFRVSREGYVAAAVPIKLVERPHAEWTVERANRIMHHDKQNLAEAARLAALPLLSSSWKETLQKRVEKRAPASQQERLSGNG